ncbi:hypothetical protein VTO42DRAFT_5581 [Malbranchea cinnamomea]
MPARIRNSQRLTNLPSHISSFPSQSSCSFISCTSLSTPSKSPSTRTFSTTPSQHATKLRRDMFEWLNGPGAVFKNPLPGSTNYLSAYDRQGKLLRANESEGEEREDGTSLPKESKSDRRPFPLNPYFVSESVLSEELRNRIYEDVVVRKKSVRTVSVLYGVDMRRVAAVVRLVALEKKMIAENKPLARPYARAVLQMLPTTPLAKDGQVQQPHEHINELPVHRLTEPQIFYPVSESRQFNRVDAGRVFSAAPAVPASERDKPGNTPEAIAKITQRPDKIERIGKGDDTEQVLQPAEVRLPHPHLVAFEHERIHSAGTSHAQRSKNLLDRIAAEDTADAVRKERRIEKEEAATTCILPERSRFEFRIRDVVVSRETTGPTGRGTKAPGARYGVPNLDRKRGAVKIPTKVVV